MNMEGQGRLERRQYGLDFGSTEPAAAEVKEGTEERLPETAGDLVESGTKYNGNKWHIWTEAHGLLNGAIANVFPVEGDGAMRVALAGTNGAELIPLLAKNKIRLYDESAVLPGISPDNVEPYDYVFVNGRNSEPLLVTQVIEDRTPEGGITLRFEDDKTSPPRTYYPKEERLLEPEEQTRFDVIRIPNLASAFWGK